MELNMHAIDCAIHKCAQSSLEFNSMTQTGRLYVSVELVTEYLRAAGIRDDRPAPKHSRIAKQRDLFYNPNSFKGAPPPRDGK